MHRYLLLPSFFLLLSFLTGPVFALPAPMSDDELLAKSDLVALIRVLSVTCTGVAKDERTGEALPSYKANAEVMEVIKGDVAKGDDVTITFHAISKGILGPWTVYYYPGEMVFTHLVRDSDAYTTTWWNGRGKLVNKAIITDLPTNAGETIEIPRRTSHPGN
jgi:hypothetical protein